MDRIEDGKPGPPKPPPLLVAVATNVSASIAGEVADALRFIPARVQTALDASGIKVTIVRRVVDARPELAGVRPRGWPAGLTYEHADACYVGSDVIVAEVHADYSTGQEVRSSRVARATRHELGHAVDEVYGYFSQDPVFLAAYNDDIVEAQSRRLDLDPYYVQSGFAGPEEAFAEIFAQLYGGGTDTVTADFLAVFSRTTRAIREKLR